MLGPELGHGGMGRVFEAWDPMLSRRVALKLVELRDPRLLELQVKEAQHQARVEHPNVCRVYEVGDASAHPYLALQLIHGAPLDEASPAPGPREAAWIMAELAGALEHAHNKGLIHGDLKPANILLEPQPDGQRKPYLVDFGLAREQETLEPGSAMATAGTPAFMSPEQATGGHVGTASDLYGLGAAFYALFAGHPPPRPQGPSDLPPPRADLAQLPGELAAILLKCLEPQSGRRYPTAGDLERDLRRWLAGDPIQARPLGPLGRCWRRIRRNALISACVGGGLLLSIGLLAWLQVQRARQGRRIALTQSFILAIQEKEEELRLERMMPPHDIAPAEARLRARMEQIRSEMLLQGDVAQAPGHYALGQGFLQLRDFRQASAHLRQAWDAGQETPETAFAIAFCDVFLELAGAPGQATRSGKAESRRWLERAVGLSAELEPARQALLAFALGDAEGCRLRCRAARASLPWFQESWMLEAATWRPFGNALPPPPAALENLRQAIRVAPSDDLPVLLELRLLARSGDPAWKERARSLMEILKRIRPLQARNLALQAGLPADALEDPAP